MSLGPVLWGRGTTAYKILMLVLKVPPTLEQTNPRSLGFVMASTFMLVTNATKEEHAVRADNNKGRAP